MNTSSLKHRLLTTILATGVGIATLLFGPRLTEWLPSFDIACVEASSTDGTLYDINQNTGTITARQLSEQHGAGRAFQIVTITDDPDQIFEHCPPSPLDYAVILESLRNRGYQHVILTTRMTWDAEPALEAKALSGRLALFNRSAIPLPVTRGATRQTMPAPLERALIKYSQVSGNYQTLPLVNQVTLPTHANGGKNTLAGFHSIESSPAADGHIPLLAHWQDKGIIPSLDLLALMICYDISPQDLSIEVGKQIRLGSDGPVIPLDQFGQTRTPSSSAETVEPTPLQADKIITQTAIANPPDLMPVCLIHAVGASTKPTNTLAPERLAGLLALSEDAMIPTVTRHFRRLPYGAAIVIIIDIALLAFWFSGFSRGNRHLAFALLAVLHCPLLYATMDLAGYWFGLSAPLITLGIIWLLRGNQIQRKQTSPIQQYRTSNPKPTLRA